MLLRASAFPRSIACICLLASIAFAADNGNGPTPYPDEKNETAWPGVGPIRVFAGCRNSSAAFWTQREADQGAVVFAGDSLAQYWQSLPRDFPALKTANRGIGGDAVGACFRCGRMCSTCTRGPSCCAIGTNDLSAHAAPADIVGIAARANPGAGPDGTGHPLHRATTRRHALSPNPAPAELTAPPATGRGHTPRDPARSPYRPAGARRHVPSRILRPGPAPLGSSRATIVDQADPAHVRTAGDQIVHRAACRAVGGIFHLRGPVRPG